jgi:hypothetical protein
MSWRPEVIADRTGKWAGNAVRLATEDEAKAYVKDLMYRWMAVTDTRVVECDDEVSHKWTADRGLVSIEETPDAGDR